jgi:hypothetical protein
VTNADLVLTDTTLAASGGMTDTLTGIQAAELVGGDGDNSIDASAFTLGGVILVGGGGDDALRGGAGDDILIGGQGNDRLSGGMGTNRLDGGIGTDTVVETRDADMVLTAATLLVGGVTEDLAGIEAAELTGGASANLLDASAFGGPVRLDGGAGDDTVWGGAGSDFLTGGTGHDTIQGGGGIDTLVESRDADMALANASLVIGTETDTLVGISHADLSGGAGINTLDASAFTRGGVVLRTGGGTDTLKGGSGDDTFVLDTGNLVAGTKVNVWPNAGTSVVRITGRSTVSQTDLEWVTWQPASSSASATIELTAGSVTSDLYTNGQAIRIVADTINLNGHTIDTGTAASAGSITLQGESITVDGGSRLLARAKGPGGSDGAITITAVNDTKRVRGLGFYNSQENAAGVTIGAAGSATVSGGVIRITAQANADRYDAGEASTGDVNFGFMAIDVGEKVNQFWQWLIDTVNGLSAFGATSFTTATASVTVGSGAVVTGQSLLAHAVASATASAEPTVAYVVGVSLGVVRASATVDVAGVITTSDDLTLRATTHNSVNVVAAPEPISDKTFAVAVSVIGSDTEVTVDRGARLTVGGDLNLLAETFDSNHTVANSVAGKSGRYAFAFAVGWEHGETRAFLDGSAFVAGDITVAASQEKTPVIDDVNMLGYIPDPTSQLDVAREMSGVKAYSATGQESSGDFFGDLTDAITDKQKALVGIEKLTDAFKEKLFGASKVPANDLDATGAVGFVVDINNVEARIGGGAGVTGAEKVQSGGSISVAATVEARPDVSAASLAMNSVAPPEKGESAKKASSPSNKPAELTHQNVVHNRTAAPAATAETGTAVAVAIGIQLNNTTATIGANGRVDAAGAIVVDAKSLNQIDPASLWGRNLVTPFTAKADFTTDATAPTVISNGNTVEVTAAHTGEGELGHWYEYVGLPQITVDLSTEDFSNEGLWKDLGSQATRQKDGFLTNLTSYANDNLGLDDNLFDSWSQSSANGQKKTKAGSITILGLQNTATATIQSGAQVNQLTTGLLNAVDFRTGGQTVTVSAEGVNEAVNLTGAFKTPSVAGLPSRAWQQVVKRSTTGKGSNTAPVPNGEGAGGALGIHGYGNIVKARIEDGVVLRADSLTVTADTRNLAIALDVAGGKSDASSTQGSIAIAVIVDTTLAQVENGATIVVGSKPLGDADAAGGVALIRATDTTHAVTVAGAVAVSDESGAGASVGLNTVVRTTEALIGNRIGDDTADTRGSFSALGGVTIAAANHGFVGTFAVAGAKATAKTGPAKPAQPETPSAPESKNADPVETDATKKEVASGNDALSRWHDLVTAALNATGSGSAPGSSNSGQTPSQVSQPAQDNTQQSKDASAKSGSIAINVVVDKARAYVRNAGPLSTGKLTVSADNDATVVALAGAVAYAKGAEGSASKAMSGSLAFTYAGGATEAFVDGATSITAGGLEITADRGGWIISISAAVGGASGRQGSAFTGSIGVVWTNYTTSARFANVAGASTITGATVVRATDSTNLVMVGGGLSFGGKGGYGVGLAFGGVTNTTTASVENVASLTHVGNLSVTAESQARIINVTASLGVATGGGGQQGTGAAGAISLNLVRNTVRATVNRLTTTSTSSGGVTVTADDSGAIYAFVGGIAYGKSSGYGLALGINVISNTVAAVVESSTLGTVGALKVEAEERSTIVGIAVGGAVSGGQGAAIAGSVGVNAVSNAVGARITGVTATRTTGVTVTALDAATMIVVTGSLGVGKSGAGVGVSIGWNRVSDGVAAFIEGSRLTATSGGVKVAATSSTLLVDVGTAGAGALVINSVANSVDAHIGAASTVSAAGDVNVVASEAASMIVVSLAVAGSSEGS